MEPIEIVAVSLIVVVVVAVVVSILILSSNTIAADELVSVVVLEWMVLPSMVDDVTEKVGGMETGNFKEDDRREPIANEYCRR